MQSRYWWMGGFDTYNTQSHVNSCCTHPSCFGRIVLFWFLHRAFLKEPQILLFDEATSALDTRTEREILESMAQLAAGRTSIFVAHRLSTAAQCDQIVVLDEGVVVEAGSHAELLERGGKYAAMWARQASVDDLYDTPKDGGTGFDEGKAAGGSMPLGGGEDIGAGMGGDGGKAAEGTAAPSA